MRHILSNYAEQRRTLKRGGGFERVSVGDIAMPGAEDVPGSLDILADRILPVILGGLSRALA